MSIWQGFVNGQEESVVLDGILYQVGVGRVQMTWLDKHSQVHSNTPTKRIGQVPNKYRKQLPNTGYRLQMVGPIPLPGR